MKDLLQRVEFYATPKQLYAIRIHGYTMTQRINNSAVCEGWVTDSIQFTKHLNNI